METAKSTTIEQVVKEMQLRYYSPKSIQNYESCLKSLLNYSEVPLEKISIEGFKNYLYHRITDDKISVSLINQSISSFKILQESVLGLNWEPLKIKRPRRERKLPIVLSKHLTFCDFIINWKGPRHICLNRLIIKEYVMEKKH